MDCPNAVLLKRVCACWGWAIHGLVFEYWDGRRTGLLLNNDGIVMGLEDAHIARRSDRESWQDVEYGDCITAFEGHLLSGAEPYICYDITLRMASGKALSFSANHLAWRGEEFRINVQPGWLQYGVTTFDRHTSQKPTHPLFKCIRSSLCQRWSLTDHKWLPEAARRQVRLVLLVAQRLNATRQLCLPVELWLFVLSHLKGYELTDGNAPSDDFVRESGGYFYRTNMCILGPNNYCKLNAYP